MNRIFAYLRHLAVGLKTNQEIHEFCVKNFNKPLTPFINHDDRELPSADHCPMVVLNFGGRALEPEQSAAIVTGQVRICFAIADTQKRGHTITSDGVYEIPGDVLICDIQEIAERVLRQMRPPSGFCAKPISSPDNAVELPYFKTWLGQEIQFESQIF